MGLEAVVACRNDDVGVKAGALLDRASTPGRTRLGRPFGAVFVALGAVWAGIAARAAETSAAAPAVIASVDLTKPFHTKSNWRLVATQGPKEEDPVFPEETVPGTIKLCLENDAAADCDPSVVGTPGQPDPDLALMWRPRFLQRTEVVYPRGRSRPPLLIIQTASVHSVDGNQAVFTQVIAYRRGPDRFSPAFSRDVGHNNNEEVRYVASGPLKGDVIVAEPADHQPWRYWVSVNVLTPAYRYRQALRYRSATGYGDGNPLPVIDSEMLNIEARLDLWRKGMPLPLPAGPCPRPHLVKMELWCG